MKVVLLRFDAPLMSFGSVVIDGYNKTDGFPYRAMLTGLIVNALGMSRLDEDAVHSLQSRVRYAARRDRLGTEMVDFQTVDFGAAGPMADGLGWTTRGELEGRRGGEASEGTHIRYRHYLADAIVTVVLTLDPDDVEPSLAKVSQALRAPARPLFLGRKCCIPSGPVWLGEAEAPSLRKALEDVPRVAPMQFKSRVVRRVDDSDKPLAAIWPEHDGDDGDPTMHVRLWPRVEDRDKYNSIHVGRRLYCEGVVNPPMQRDVAKEDA